MSPRALLALRSSVGGDPGDDARMKHIVDGLDHLVRRIAINADTHHAGQIFLDACETDGALEHVSPELETLFLDRLLPTLHRLKQLPPKLVPFMILRFRWPVTLRELAAAVEMRADLHALLERHARENGIDQPEASFIALDVDRALNRRNQLAIAVGAILVVLWIIGAVVLPAIIHHGP